MVVETVMPSQESCNFFTCNMHECSCFVPMSTLLDFIEKPTQTFFLVFMIRFLRALIFGPKCYHADQNWQGSEMAYQMAYSDVVPVVKSWDWIDNYAIRNTFYPFYLSLPMQVLRVTGTDSNMLVVNSVYFMNSLV